MSRYNLQLLTLKYPYIIMCHIGTLKNQGKRNSTYVQKITVKSLDFHTAALYTCFSLVIKFASVHKHQDYRNYMPIFWCVALGSYRGQPDAMLGYFLFVCLFVFCCCFPFSFFVFSFKGYSYVRSYFKLIGNCTKKTCFVRIPICLTTL